MGDLPPQRHLILILARNFASRLATAAFLVDADGRVIYFNEAAEQLLGTGFGEAHGMAREEYLERFRVADAQGERLAMADTPIGIAVNRREPSHTPVTITSGDGVARRIEATAFPLMAHAGDLVGAIAFFCEDVPKSAEG